MTALLYATHYYFQSTVKNTISTQQFLTTTILAEEIDQKLQSAHSLLIAIAQEIKPATVNSRQQALRFLKTEAEFASIFSNGMFLYDRHGRIVAELPLGISRTGMDFSFRDYIKSTLEYKKPYISDPYISSQSHHHPAIMFTAPVFDTSGGIIAILGGSVDLSNENFLGKLASLKIGKTGYMFLFNTNRVMIYHPDASRIMKQDVPPGANRLYDRALNGFEGTDETVNSRGLKFLTSFKHLKSKNWILGANYPIAEAYAPIIRLQIFFAASIIPVLLLLFFVMRRFLKKMTEPLIDFTQHIELLPTKIGQERLYPNHEVGEIATLGNVFNGLIAQLDSQREESEKRELLYRTVVEFASDLVFWISPDRRAIYYISPSCDRITGYHEEEFYQDPELLNRIIHPDSRHLWNEHTSMSAINGCSESLEIALVTRQGLKVWTSHVCSPVYSVKGDYHGIRGSFIDITLIKESELARHESEENFRTLFDSVGDAIFIIDLQGLIVEVNKEAQRRLGYLRQQLIGMSIADIESNDCVAYMSDRLQAIQQQGFVCFECALVRCDGTIIPVEANARLTEFKGKPALLAVARDIAERKKAEQTLHRQNEYLLALHETTLGLISRLDLHSLLSAIITRAAKLMDTEHGYIYLLNQDKTELNIQVQLGIFDTFEHHPLMSGEGMAGYVWKSKKPFHADDYSTWKGRIGDPNREVLRAMAGVPLTSGGDVIGVIGLAYIDDINRFDDEKMGQLTRFAELASLALENARLYDAAQKELSERIQVEASLRKLSHAVEQSPVSIVITDTKGTIEYANPHFAKLTGYELDELLGKTPSILKSGFTRQAEYKNLWDTILAGGEWSGEFQNRKKNGDLYWEMALISPIRDASGAITHFVAVKEDISDRKRLENQLRHSQKMEAIGQLAGGIAHDFNNILTAIIGYATIMQMKIDNKSPIKNTADQILAAAERGASLTQGLLAFSRKQISNLNRINLNEIIGRVEKLLVRLIGEDIHINSMLADQELPLMADSIQLEQVLMNLSTNARDAMPNGGDITIRTEPVTLDANFVQSQGFGEQGDYALLTFSDTGCGMSEETAKRVFEPFYTTKETGKGTGLGLSIVYGIIKKHGGYVTCKSSPGKGTIFCIYLPLTLDMKGGRVEDVDTTPFCGGHEVILLAEDDETMRTLTKELLEEFGYKVIEVEDGCQAVQKYREQGKSIQLVILDAVMPGMKGMDVYREIHNIDPHALVLFCSGYNLDMIKGDDKLDQNLHFIAKPFVPKELLMKVREVLENAT